MRIEKGGERDGRGFTMRGGGGGFISWKEGMKRLSDSVISKGGGKCSTHRLLCKLLKRYFFYILTYLEIVEKNYFSKEA